MELQLHQGLCHSAGAGSSQHTPRPLRITLHLSPSCRLHAKNRSGPAARPPHGRSAALAVSAAAVLSRREDRTAQAAAAAPLLLQLDEAAPPALSTAGDAAAASRSPGFDSIESALEAIRAGQPVVVLDDEDRENEGDLIIAAEKVTPAMLEFFRKHTSGFICVGMEGDCLDALDLPLMVSSTENEEAMCTAFTVTVDARSGTSTGISAADRALTLRLLADPAAAPSDFRRPGHICPLRSRPGGVLTRPGHTEAGVDLARLAGCQPAGALCELVDPEDGSMARTPQLLAFAARHGLRCITIADLVCYRQRHDPLSPDQAPAAAAGSNGAAAL